MDVDDKVEAIIEQAAGLSDDAQAELVRSLAEMRFGHLAVDPADDDASAAPSSEID